MVKVVSFEDDFGVLVVRVGDAEYDDTPSSIVREVNALAQLATANAHQHGTCIAVLFPHTEDLASETLDLGFELLLVGGFHEDAFLAQGLNPWQHILLSPLVRVMVQHLVGGEEEEDAPDHLLTDFLKHFAQLDDLWGPFSQLEGGWELGFGLETRFENVYKDLIFVNHMRIHEFVLEGHPDFLREDIQWRKRARSQDYRPRFLW